MTNQPLVSLIILNYNQVEVTCSLLKSVQQLTYPNLEIIVVDNQSAQSPLPALEALGMPNVKIILNDQNLGFAGGNNVGIRQASGDFLFILNNDTELASDVVECLLEPFKTDERIGVTCPKIRYYDQPSIIQYAGYTPLNSFTGQAWAIGSHQEDRGQFDRAGVTHFAHGAAMLVKRSAIEQAGGLPECYFLYYEELDWCIRIREAGYTIYYQPTALVYHKESLSVGRGNPLKVYYHNRNRILFMRRNVSAPLLLIFALYYAGLALPKAVLLYSLRGQWHFLKALLNGVGWNLRHGAPRPAAALSDPQLLLSTSV